MRIQSLIEKSRYIVVVAALALLTASAFALFWGVMKTYKAILLIVNSNGLDPLISFSLIQLIDAFLIATVLYVLAVSIFELFIGGLKLPEWMLAHNLHHLKAKVSSAIILVMAVRFLEQLLEWKDSDGILRFGAATTLVSAVLIAFCYFGDKE